MNWIPYDWNKPDTRPKEYGKYFIHRKDGKTHWETWNGSGWAYNERAITHWAHITPPNLNLKPYAVENNQPSNPIKSPAEILQAKGITPEQNLELYKKALEAVYEYHNQFLMTIYEYLEDHDNPDLKGYDWEEQMLEAVIQWYKENPGTYQMKPKNAIRNYLSWKREKYSPFREPQN